MATEQISDGGGSEWLAEGADFGGYVYTHRHWDAWETAYLYGDPNEAWAECTRCGAKLTLPDGRLGSATVQ